MIISKLALTATEDEINAGLTAAFEKMAETQGEAIKKIKEPRVLLENGILRFKCKASMGVLPLPVEAQIRLAPAMSGTALAITLVKVSLAMMGGESAAKALMGQVATAVAGRPGLSVDGNTLMVSLSELSALRGIQLGGTLKDVALVNGTLSLDFS